MADPRIDPRAEALGVYIEDNPNAVYHIVSVGYQDPSQAGGNHNIYFNVADEQSKPLANIDTYMDWNGRDPKKDNPTKEFTDPKGQSNMGMYSNLDIHLKNGPYFGYVGATVVKGIVSNIQSDIVRGMGLPEHTHVNFILTYQKGGIIPPPPVAQWTVASDIIVSQSDTQIVHTTTLVKK